MVPYVLELGVGCFDTTKHPPAGNDGDVSGCKTVIEPMTVSWHVPFLKWDVKELEVEGVFEWSRSLSSFDAADDLLHQLVKVGW